jgi:hypothetical protein
MFRLIALALILTGFLVVDWSDPDETDCGCSQLKNLKPPAKIEVSALPLPYS